MLVPSYKRYRIPYYFMITSTSQGNILHSTFYAIA